MIKNTYHVGFIYTEAGYMTVEAENVSEAERIVLSRLTEEGFDAFRYKYQCCYRNYHLNGSEEVKD